MKQRTVAALMTPPGDGGISVIEIFGAGVEGALAKIFRTKSSQGANQVNKLLYGHIYEGDAVVDEVVVRVAACDRAEINCHGGIAAAGEIMRLLAEHGIEELSAEKFVRTSTETLDGFQLDALMLLPNAATPLAVRVMCDQLSGAMSSALRNIDLNGASAANELATLADTVRFGRLLVQPLKLVIAGRPNVGKSSLFNALVGENRVIVAPVPGTTRDYVNETISFGGYPVELFDTAGLRAKGGVVEMKGVAAAERVLTDADQIIVVIDAGAGLTRGDERVLELASARNPIVALNKCDLAVRALARTMKYEKYEISALTGTGLAELRAGILRRLPAPSDFPTGSPVALTDEQADNLRAISELVLSGAVKSAQERLAQLHHPLRHTI